MDNLVLIIGLSLLMIVWLLGAIVMWVFLFVQYYAKFCEFTPGFKGFYQTFVSEFKTTDIGSRLYIVGLPLTWIFWLPLTIMLEYRPMIYLKDTLKYIDSGDKKYINNWQPNREAWY